MSVKNRFPGGKNKDNTARLLTYDFQAPAFNATLAITTSKSRTVVREIITAAQTINIGVDSGVSNNNDAPYDGDEIEFNFKNTAGTASVVTFGTGFGSQGTASVAAGKYGSVRFRFYAADNLWIEQSRALTM